MGIAQPASAVENRNAGQVNEQLEHLTKEIDDLDTLIGQLSEVLSPISRITVLEKLDEPVTEVVPLANQIRINVSSVNNIRMRLEQILGAIEL